MENSIKTEDIRDNTFFWISYISWFRGFDIKNEIPIDEALGVIGIDRDGLYNWSQDFFYKNISDENVKFIGGKLDDEMSFHIEFQENEIVFFLNDIYIGNLGGHFEAWFLTWYELLAFDKYDLLFLLLLPMVGIEPHQTEKAQEYIVNKIKTIPKFEKDAKYITDCIMNGIAIKGQFFNQNGVGTINHQNHSVRNIEEYPRYKEDVIELNLALMKFVSK